MIIYDRVGNGKIILKLVITFWNIEQGTSRVGKSNENTNKNISFT